MNIPRTALFTLFWILFGYYDPPVVVLSTAVIGATAWLAWKVVAWVLGI